MDSTYWSRVARQRIARRQALAMAGGTALGAALLAACGGGGEKGDVSGLVTKAVDTSRQAKAGGVLKWWHSGDPASLDPNVGIATNRILKNLTNSLFVQLEPAYMGAPAKIVPDLAESWEISPDKTQLTLRIRPGVKWHNLPPVNGRPLDSQDILFSWDRLTRINSNRASIANSVNPAAPIVSLTAPDERTVVIKLKEPVSYILVIIADYTGGNLVIVPKETDTTLDLRRTYLGTGPYMLTDYKPSGGFYFKRNPEYYNKDKPWIERLEMPIVPEYATGLSQFRAGSVYEFSTRAEDVIQTKSDVPELQMVKTEVSATSTHTGFGWLPEGKSPFLDQRVRQAFSLAIDRDSFINALYNVEQYEAQGLPVETRWNTALGATFTGYWLDPKGKDFGPNAKYFQHNLPEAKRLLAAAGYPNGLSVTSYYPSNGVVNLRHLEVMDAFATDAGFKINPNPVDLNTEYPKWRDAKGQLEGWVARVGTSGSGPEDAIGRLLYDYYSKGSVNFYGFNASGRSDPAGDPFVDGLIEKGLSEFDEERRKSIAFELQRYLAEKQYTVLWPGGASGFGLAWPTVRNFGVWASGWVPQPISWWLDQTKAPINQPS